VSRDPGVGSREAVTHEHAGAQQTDVVAEHRRHDPHPPGRHGEGQAGDGITCRLEEAIADERAAQEKYRRGLERCADPAACEVFEQLLREEMAHERVLEARYVEVKKRVGLSGAGRD